MKFKYVYDKVVSEIDANYEIIDKSKFEVWTALFNQKCVDNSADVNFKDRNIEVIMCMCIDEWGDMWLHAINKVWDKYIDNTLWYRYKDINYYFIKNFPVHFDSHAQYRNFFNSFRNHLVRKHKASFDLRKISWIDII